MPEPRGTHMFFLSPMALQRLHPRYPKRYLPVVKADHSMLVRLESHIFKDCRKFSLCVTPFLDRIIEVEKD